MEHDEEPRAAPKPSPSSASQFLHAYAPSSEENSFIGHGLQEVWPPATWYWPGEQGVHAVPSADSRNVPAWQSEHEVEPSVALKRPGSQLVHSYCPYDD